MRKYIFTICWLMMSATCLAQNPSWAKKAANAVFTLKTFSADGSLLVSTNGFFVGDQGEAISSYTPFKDAQRAVVIDAQGKELEVACIIGVNDMYDVAKFQVSAKKTQALTVAGSTSTNGSVVWLLPYAVKKAPVCTKGTVSNAETHNGGFAYYTLGMSTTDQHVGCPILNEQGEAIGILQPSANGNKPESYAMMPALPIVCACRD